MVTFREIVAGAALRRAANPWVLSSLLTVAICAGPLLLWYSPLRWYFLKQDDFVYLARSRSSDSLRQYLFEPHNGHVVPLFRIQTHVLAALAGSLECVPHVLCVASYCTLVAAMATLGHIVAWETGKAALGLLAMAILGLSTVLGPAFLWYAASQALAAGLQILLMLAALQAWKARRSWWLLLAGTLAAAAAPVFWTAGYTAGLVGLVYLWSDGGRACRLASPLPAAGSALTGVLVWWMAGPAAPAASTVSQRCAEFLASLPTVATHTTQAICEALVLNNLGLDAATSARQSFVLCGMLVGTWLWTRRAVGCMTRKLYWRLNPLEAAGATLIFANFGLIFAARGPELAYDHLRALGWYNAIPQLGAVLFAAGWWNGPIAAPPPRSIEAPKRLDLLGIALLAAIMFGMQSPRAARVTFQYDRAASEAFTGDLVTGPRTREEMSARAKRQRLALAELDKLERKARRAGMNRAEVLRSVSLIEVPGMPTGLEEFGAADLLDLTDLQSDRPHGPKRRSAANGSDQE